MSEPPAAPPNDAPQPPPRDDDAAAHDRDGFDIARVLRVAVIVAAFISGFAAARGVIRTVQHLAREIPAGTIARVELSGRDGYRMTFEGGTAANFPIDILETTGRPIVLRPGMRVSKRVGSLTYSIDGEGRGGVVWAMRQWILPAPVTLPLVIYFVLSWLLVFRTGEHRRPILVEALVWPIVRWLAITLASLIVLALIAGCAMLIFRMAG